MAFPERENRSKWEEEIKNSNKTPQIWKKPQVFRLSFIDCQARRLREGPLPENNGKLLALQQ